MAKRRAAVWGLAAVLATGAAVAGAEASRADIIVNPGSSSQYVLGPGGQVVSGTPTSTSTYVPVPTNGASPVRISGVQVDGTYRIQWSVTDPENRSDTVQREGNVTLTITKLTRNTSTGDVFGDGVATGDLGEGPTTGTVKAKVTAAGVLDTVLVNLANAPQGQKSTLLYGFGDNRCRSCVTVESGVLTQFKQTFVRRVPREDGRGLKAYLGTFTGRRV